MNCEVTITISYGVGGGSDVMVVCLPIITVYVAGALGRHLSHIISVPTAWIFPYTTSATKGIRSQELAHYGYHQYMVAVNALDEVYKGQ